MVAEVANGALFRAEDVAAGNHATDPALYASLANFGQSLSEDSDRKAETLRSVRSVIQGLSRQVQDSARIPVDETSFEMLRSCQQEMLTVFDHTLQKLAPEITNSIEEMNQFFTGAVESDVADALRQCLLAQEERTQSLLQSLDHLSSDLHVTCVEEAKSELEGDALDNVDDPYFNEHPARAARRRSLEDLIQKEKNRTHQLHGFVLRHMKQLLKDQFDQISANVNFMRVHGEIHRNELERSITSRNNEEEQRLRWELEEERQKTLLALGQSSGNLELVREVESIRDTIVNVTELVANSDKNCFEELQPEILRKLKFVMKQVSSNLDHMRRASISAPGNDSKEALQVQGDLMSTMEPDEGISVSTRSAEPIAGVDATGIPTAVSPGGREAHGDALMSSGREFPVWAEGQDAPPRPRRSGGSSSAAGRSRAPAPAAGSKRLASSSPRASGGRGSTKDKRERTPGPSKPPQRKGSFTEAESASSAKSAPGGPANMSDRGSKGAANSRSARDYEHGGGSAKLSNAGSATMSPGRSGGNGYGSARNPSPARSGSARNEANDNKKVATSRDSSPAAMKRDSRAQASPKRGVRSPGREASPKRRPGSPPTTSAPPSSQAVSSDAPSSSTFPPENRLPPLPGEAPSSPMPPQGELSEVTPTIGGPMATPPETAANGVPNVSIPAAAPGPVGSYTVATAVPLSPSSGGNFGAANVMAVAPATGGSFAVANAVAAPPSAISGGSFTVTTAVPVEPKFGGSYTVSSAVAGPSSTGGSFTVGTAGGSSVASAVPGGTSVAGGSMTVSNSSAVGVPMVGGSLSAPQRIGSAPSYARDTVVAPPSAIPVPIPVPSTGRASSDSRQDPRIFARPATVSQAATTSDPLRSPNAAWRQSSPAVGTSSPVVPSAPAMAGSRSPGRPPVLSSPPHPLARGTLGNEEGPGTDDATLISTPAAMLRSPSNSGSQVVADASGVISKSLLPGAAAVARQSSLVRTNSPVPSMVRTSSPAASNRPVSSERGRQMRQVAPARKVMMVPQGAASQPFANVPQQTPTQVAQPMGRTSFGIQEALRFKAMIPGATPVVTMQVASPAPDAATVEDQCRSFAKLREDRQKSEEVEEMCRSFAQLRQEHGIQ